jgi:hypothetical protein
MPAPLQVSVPSQNTLSGQGLPDGSKVQVALQQSPPAILPSSHASPASTAPLPQHVFVVSMHTVPAGQGLPVEVHPSAFSSQYSVPLQNAPSSGHAIGIPAWQIPATHVSTPLQYDPSSQSLLLMHALMLTLYKPIP